MDGKLSQSNPYHPIYLRVGLLIVLLTSITAVSNSVLWIYRRVHNSLGVEIAEVVVAFLVILILVLIGIGFRTGISTKQVLRQHRYQALRIYRALKWCRIFRALWAYLGPPIETATPPTDAKEDTSKQMTLPSRPPRRGRPPTYPIDRWIRVVSAWENRDPMRNPLTLSEFLSQEFGTYADGSPRMSENSYYDWKKKVYEEMSKLETGEKRVSA